MGNAPEQQDGMGGQEDAARVPGGEPGANGAAGGARVYTSLRERLDANTKAAGFIRRQSRAMAEIVAERKRQDAKYPEEKPGTGMGDGMMLSITQRELREAAWALANHDLANLREEVIQVAAVCLKWVEIMDARGA